MNQLNEEQLINKLTMSKFHCLFIKPIFWAIFKTFLVNNRNYQGWCIQMTISKTIDKFKIEDLHIDRHMVGRLYRMLRNSCCASINKTF